MEKEWLDTYTGQTTDELLALKDRNRIDSLVLAFEQAIQEKAEADISVPERYVLAIEAMEREVNNGGWEQFFDNTENEFNDVLTQALNEIGCPETAVLSSDTLEASELGTELDEFDDRYYGLTEPIADRLFEYIEQNSSDFKLT